MTSWTHPEIVPVRFARVAADGSRRVSRGVGENPDVNLVDLAAIVLVLFAVARGSRAGFVLQAFGLLGVAAGIAAIALLAPAITDALATVDPPLRSVGVIMAFFLAIAIGQAVGGRLAAAIRPGRPGSLRTLDALGGAVFGLAQGIVLVWLIGGILVAAPSPRLSLEARRSAVVRQLDARLPSPVAVMAEIARAAEAAGLPDVFVGVAPAPVPAGEGPEQREAERIAVGARGSTVRVEAAACLRLQSGTGFAVAPGVFVTNAHVVAGSGEVELSVEGGGDRFDAEVVLFDPALDLAVLRAPGLDLAPLSFAQRAPRRGDTGAALGHTGGGRLRTIPAVVNRTLAPIGRDIYGKLTVRREVVEVGADVAQGDSGGPLVLANGRVGGVIFSESRLDRAVGYALSPPTVAAALAEGLRTTAPVDTGRCIG